MTEKEKTHITMLRERGYTYKQISDETGIGLSTVKMHFNRILARQRPARVEITMPDKPAESAAETPVTQAEMAVETPMEPAKTVVETPVAQSEMVVEPPVPPTDTPPKPPVMTPNTPVAPMETTNHTPVEHGPVCLQCGKPFDNGVSGRKRFCSDRCRIRWWMEHPEHLRDAKKHQCPVCGKVFFAYKPARYCSLDCYHHSRRKAGRTSV